MPLLKACLNGGRSLDEHPRIPRAPEELAAEGRAAVGAGAQVLHLHAYTGNGVETLAPDACAEAVRAVRAACPGIPISLSTSAAIEPDPRRRLELVTAWTELPDVVSANQGETAIIDLCGHLIARGVGIEAGLLSVADAHAFVAAGIADRCVRVLVEPLDETPEVAAGHAAAIEQVLTDARVELEQVHHGDGIATWRVMERAITRGHGIRVGLEDTTVLPDGRLAADNAELVRTAAAMLAG
jgi:uncharacterized protein (DUF849 family)